MQKQQIPDIVVARLPQYLRSLQRMAREGRQVTSSQELAERLGISAAQIRKDLSQFGEFGKQGTGYHIPFLTEQLQIILHVNHDWDMVVVGAGGIGSAIARYKGFNNRGFNVRFIFDNDPEVIGSKSRRVRSPRLCAYGRDDPGERDQAGNDCGAHLDRPGCNQQAGRSRHPRRS